MKPEFLFYFCDGISSVFDSQVLAFLETLVKKRFFKRIYLFVGNRNKADKNYFRAKNISSEIQTVFFKSYPNYPIFNYINIYSMQSAIKNQKINLESVIFHTRGELIAWHLTKILGTSYYKQVVPDVRGVIEDIDHYYSINIIKKYLKVRNYRKGFLNLRKFHYISTVSNSLKEYLIVNYNIEPEKIKVIPCLAGNKFQFNKIHRENIRKEFDININDRLIIFSSGGTAAWQNNDVILELAKKGVKVFNLSQKEIVHKNIINKFVAYDEVPSYLNAADIAIIWRDKSVVNKVASPVKFSEYVCAGLPVIANRSVDMISEYINKYECGILLDSLDKIDLTTINKISSNNRNKISNDGIHNFGVEAIVEKYLQIYSSIKC